jgi:hypothetical protein
MTIDAMLGLAKEAALMVKNTGITPTNVGKEGKAGEIDDTRKIGNIIGEYAGDQTAGNIEAALAFKKGNCQEMANLAFEHICKRGAYRAHKVAFNFHVFVVIGASADLDGEFDIGTLNNEQVVFCDPWIVHFGEAEQWGDDLDTSGAYQADVFFDMLEAYCDQPPERTGYKGFVQARS